MIKEYELTKSKKHPRYRFVTDFYKANGLRRQNFIKYYNRYKQARSARCLLPQKRCPRYKIKRTVPFIEEREVALRKQGNNRYDIYARA